jgi:hypothetical protein
MSETTAQRLSRLHSLSTMTIDAGAIDLRAGAIDALCEDASVQQAITAAAVATGLAVDLSKIEWLIKPVSEVDPSFAPVELDKGVAAACSAMTTAFLAGDDLCGLAAALGVLSARMGQRDKHIDDRQNETAQHSLWDIQRAALPEANFSPPASKIAPDQLKALADALSASQVQSAVAPLKAVLAELMESASARDDAMVDAFDALSARQSALEEEMRMHWWVIGKASTALGCPLADLPIFEAAARAALELVSMVSSQRPAGPFAAPALLERALQRADGAGNEKQSLSSAIVDIPMAVRRKIFVSKPSTTVVPGTFPIMLAAEWSIESGDEDDWQPRFKRVANVDPKMVITPIEFAQQLYRESLLWELLA